MLLGQPATKGVPTLYIERKLRCSRTAYSGTRVAAADTPFTETVTS